MAEATAEAPRRPHGPVHLRDRYRIDPDHPIEELNSPSAAAFNAEDRRDPGRKIFALICTPGLPPRGGALQRLSGSSILGLLPLLDWGSIFWPPLGQVCLMLIYQRPLGGRLSLSSATIDTRVNEYDLPKLIIDPLLVALTGLSAIGVPHREIRPDNIFYMDEDKTELVLGDCATVPPGFNQPVVFETIENGMANSGGRDRGDFREDLYALGVMSVFLLLGENPTAKMTNDELLLAKINVGTYATLCGRERVPVAMLEPLRGLLSDDPTERWGLTDLEMWISGRQSTPIQKKVRARSEFPFSFAGRDHSNERALAHAFSQNIAEAAKALREYKIIKAVAGDEKKGAGPPAKKAESTERHEGRFDHWLRRSLKNVDLAQAIANIVEQSRVSQDKAQTSDEYIVAQAVTIMDPDGPIRYKGFAFMPNSFGPALAVELLRRGNAQVPAETLALDIPAIWCAQHAGPGTEALQMLKQFSLLRGFLKINDMGYGIERCLYELNPSLPCQSALIINDYVVSVEELLPALDDAANRVDAKAKPIDRHIAAFIAARFDADIEPHLRTLAQNDEARSLIGLLSLLAFIQWKLKSPPAYGLASWLGGLLGPAINTYHNRETRREIEKEIPRLVRQGSLPELFDLIDNAEKRRLDAETFAEAQAEFLAAETEIQEIESSDSARAESAEKSGQNAAAMTSIVLAMTFLVIYFIVGGV